MSVLTLLITVQVRGDPDEYNPSDDVHEVERLLYRHCRCPGFEKTKVFIDGQQTSIREYFNAPEEGDSYFNIGSRNPYEVSHLINIVLSCKYSEFVIHYIKLMDTFFDKCVTVIEKFWFLTTFYKTKKLKRCFSTYHSTIVKHSKNNFPSMIFTLAGLFKFTKNVVHKYHEVMRVLLPWYLYIQRYSQTTSGNKNYRFLTQWLESTTITHFQIKNRLERFIVKNCYGPKELEIFKNGLNGKLDETDIFETNDTLLQNYLTDNVYNQFPIFVEKFNTKSHISDLLNAFEKAAVGVTMEIKWKGGRETIKNVYNHIKNSIDVGEILEFDKNIQEVIYEITIWRELLILRELRISANEYSSENIDFYKSKLCTTLFYDIRSFHSDLKSYKKLSVKVRWETRPIYLINLFKKAESELSSLCTKLETYNVNKITKATIQSIAEVENILKNGNLHSILDTESQDSSLATFYSDLLERPICGR